MRTLYSADALNRYNGRKPQWITLNLQSVLHIFCATDFSPDSLFSEIVTRKYYYLLLRFFFIIIII